MKKGMFSVVIFLIVSMSLFANGQSDDTSENEIKTLTMWCAYSQPGRIEAMDSLIAEYEAMHPDIDVVRELVPWSNVRQKWIAAKMANTLPQMVVDGDGGLVNIFHAGDLDYVDDVIEKVGGKEAFLEGPLKGLSENGRAFALPHYTLSWKMVVRTDWLDELGLPIPKTWEEFAEAAIAMTNPPERYGFDMPMSKSATKSREWLAYFLRTNGAEYFSKEGDVNFNTPETIETVSFLVDLIEKTGRQAAINYTENDLIDNFIKGNTGFIFCSASFIKNAVINNPEILDNCTIIDTPMNSAYPKDGAGLVGIGKFKGVEYSEETSDFMAFLLEQDVYRNFLLSMPTMLPITVKGFNDPEYWGNEMIAPYKDLYMEYLKGAESGARVGMDYGPTPVAAAGLTGSEVENMFQSIVVDGISVEEAVAATHKRMKENLTAAGY